MVHMTQFTVCVSVACCSYGLKIGHTRVYVYKLCDAVTCECLNVRLNVTVQLLQTQRVRRTGSVFGSSSFRRTVVVSSR